MRDTFLRILTIDEKNILHLMLEDAKSGYRAKTILLKDEGYTVPQIRKITNHHDHNIRKWIHRFNEKGIDGIRFWHIWDLSIIINLLKQDPGHLQ